MKRGGPLKRNKPLKAKKSLKRKSGLKVKSAGKQNSMAGPNARWRSRAYLDWVKAQQCVMCEKPADDPHHIKHVGHFSGAGLTAPDFMAIPVCRTHHYEIHARPELWPLQYQWVLETLDKAFREGVLVEGEFEVL